VNTETEVAKKLKSLTQLLRCLQMSDYIRCAGRPRLATSPYYTRHDPARVVLALQLTAAERLHNMALHRRIIFCMFSKLLAILGITVLLASATDVPPKSLVLENFKKATVIVKGIIETSNAPRPGVTVANFRVSRCYRGSFKPGDAISYASFREGDSYSSEYLHTDLIVFLRKRSPHFAPPDWETATDLSEFLYSSDLEATLPTGRRKKHQ
jgi:hypothetical protein